MVAESYDQKGHVMQAILRLVVILTLAFGLNACSKFKRYDGPEVTRIVVNKSERNMYLMHNDKVLKAYKFDLGFAPTGHKQEQGDGKTPEGRYFINRRNPNSEFYLSLGINYPNDQDKAVARKAGKNPGGDIFIHGGPKLWRDRKKVDWTFGCISVTNKEMETVYSMVQQGTPVDIFP
ncbi:MAG: L,D-transpeptidase family protein [Rhodobacterales bacterium]|jgi:murein L,D-transpeptidase YafK